MPTRYRRNGFTTPLDTLELALRIARREGDTVAVERLMAEIEAHPVTQRERRAAEYAAARRAEIMAEYAAARHAPRTRARRNGMSRNDKAAARVVEALRAGAILHFDSAAGSGTVGPYHTATGPKRYAFIRYGRRPLDLYGTVQEIAGAFVSEAGVGNVISALKGTRKYVNLDTPLSMPVQLVPVARRNAGVTVFDLHRMNGARKNGTRTYAVAIEDQPDGWDVSAKSLSEAVTKAVKYVFANEADPVGTRFHIRRSDQSRYEGQTYEVTASGRARRV